MSKKTPNTILDKKNWETWTKDKTLYRLQPLTKEKEELLSLISIAQYIKEQKIDAQWQIWEEQKTAWVSLASIDVFQDMLLLYAAGSLEGILDSLEAKKKDAHLILDAKKKKYPTQILQALQKEITKQIYIVKEKLTGSPSIRERTVFQEKKLTPWHKEDTILQEPRKIISTWAKLRTIVWSFSLALGLGFVIYEYFLKDPEVKISIKDFIPTMPDLLFTEGAHAKLSDPTESEKFYQEGLKWFIQDTKINYEKASHSFLEALKFDAHNTKALGLLVTTYIYLLEVSADRDEAFVMIKKLIEIARLRGIDLVETVIADVEFYILLNNYDAAMKRIVQFSATQPQITIDLFYYTSKIFFLKDEWDIALEYLQKIDKDNIHDPKVLALQGSLAQKQNKIDIAQKTWEFNLKLFPSHVKSYVALIKILPGATVFNTSLLWSNFFEKQQHHFLPQELKDTYYTLGIKSLENADPSRSIYFLEKALDQDKENILIKKSLLEAKMQMLKISYDAKDVPLWKSWDLVNILYQAEQYMLSQKWNAALFILMEAKQKEYKDPLIQIKLGELFFHMGQYEDAKSQYEMATKKNPQDLRLWSAYFDVMVKSYDWDLLKQAILHFQASATYQKNPLISNNILEQAQGNMYLQQGNYVRAEEIFSRLIKDKRIQSAGLLEENLMLSLAKSLLMQKKGEKASFYYALVRRYKPYDQEIIFGIADSICASQSIEDGITFLEIEQKKFPYQTSPLMAKIGSYYMQKGNAQKGCKLVQDAIAQDPALPDPYIFWAECSLNAWKDHKITEKKAIQNALDAYQSALDRGTQNPKVYIERYKLFVKLLKFDVAQQELLKLYQIFPRYPGLHFYMGYLYFVQQNFVEAEKELLLEIANTPESFIAYLTYGKLLIETGNHQKAIDILNKAISLQPNSADARQQAGWANYLLKQYQAAVALLESAIKLDPANPLMYRRLGLVYRDMADLKEACRMFNLYLEMEPDAPDKADFQACVQ